MQLKDYYKILRVHPTASATTIKKAFRQLALQFHPDRNPGNLIAEAHFKEIQEAYQVLINPSQREEYNYKRWYNRSIGKKYTEKAITPTALLAECTKINNYLASVNIFQLDYLSLSHHIHNLLSEDAIALLQQYNDIATNKNIVKELLKSIDTLPLTYAEPIAEKLSSVTGLDEALKEAIKIFLQNHRRRYWWKKYQLVIVAAITLLLCLGIFWITRQ
jgi:molecular chaperone DnaJ